MEIRTLKEVQEIIDRGKTKGFLTLDEVNQILPADALSAEQIDDVMAMLVELEIELVDQSAASGTSPGGEPDEDLDEEPFAVAESDEQIAPPRTSGLPADPVRYYFHEMGRIPLLGREGEVELARRIEEASEQVRNEAFASPLALAYVLDLAERIESGELALIDVVDEGEEDAGDERAATERALRFHLGVERIRRLAIAPARDQRARASAERVQAMTALGLGRRHFAAIVSSMRSAAASAVRCQTALRRCVRPRSCAPRPQADPARRRTILRASSRLGGRRRQARRGRPVDAQGAPHGRTACPGARERACPLGRGHP